MVGTEELGVMIFLFLSLSLVDAYHSSIKSVMSNHVTISSAKPCKQSEIIITFAILRLLSCRDPLMLIWQQH